MVPRFNLQSVLDVRHSRVGIVRTGTEPEADGADEDRERFGASV